MLCAGVCCCLLIPSVIMFACSFDTLNPHEIGLHMNGVACTLDPETQENGRYFLGLGHYFVTYPANLQYIEFSNSAEGGARNKKINLWTKDGQEVFAEIGFYYQIIRSELSTLYYLYGEEYISVIEDIATNTFRDVSTRYDTIQFFTQRDAINNVMHAALDARLRETVMVTVPRFNLLSLDMPDRFETAIVDKVIKEQEKKTLEFQQVSGVIVEETKLEQAKANKAITILQANSTAQGTLIVAKAKADAFLSLQTGAASLRKTLATELGLTSGSPVQYDELMHYMWLDVVRGQAGNSKLVFNVPNMLLSA